MTSGVKRRYPTSSCARQTNPTADLCHHEPDYRLFRPIVKHQFHHTLLSRSQLHPLPSSSLLRLLLLLFPLIMSSRSLCQAFRIPLHTSRRARFGGSDSRSDGLVGQLTAQRSLASCARLGLPLSGRWLWRLCVCVCMCWRWRWRSVLTVVCSCAALSSSRWLVRRSSIRRALSWRTRPTPGSRITVQLRKDLGNPLSLSLKYSLQIVALSGSVLSCLLLCLPLGVRGIPRSNICISSISCRSCSSLSDLLEDALSSQSFSKCILQDSSPILRRSCLAQPCILLFSPHSSSVQMILQPFLDGWQIALVEPLARCNSCSSVHTSTRHSIRSAHRIHRVSRQLDDWISSFSPLIDRIKYQTSVIIQIKLKQFVRMFLL
ncbi:hypothetical protein IE81DRAFT_59861 [Ceraceosorus guamensis]|uniref:Uncharacterized protein n=1 Tax=Ceraceosorus guamensis TaxID=1522189 RepID=A0A316W814_9BASI|nr:hypothetical protein IE81DRAFT_59861 [Ceraceosorus guamensis]PWN43815.1 hypothetical protein IE81DRAFT_59861 [Ceraceosorus guamensis]